MQQDDPKAGEGEGQAVRSDLAEPSRPGGHHGVRRPMERSTPPPPPEGVPDEALADAVSAALDADGRLATASITVEVATGNVTLLGTTPLEFQRDLAIALASEVPGVLVVMSRLDVEETRLE